MNWEKNKRNLQTFFCLFFYCQKNPSQTKAGT